MFRTIRNEGWKPCPLYIFCNKAKYGLFHLASFSWVSLASTSTIIWEYLRTLKRERGVVYSSLKFSNLFIKIPRVLRRWPTSLANYRRTCFITPLYDERLFSKLDNALVLVQFTIIPVYVKIIKAIIGWKPWYFVVKNLKSFAEFSKTKFFTQLNIITKFRSILFEIETIIFKMWKRNIKKFKKKIIIANNHQIVRQQLQYNFLYLPPDRFISLSFFTHTNIFCNPFSTTLNIIYSFFWLRKNIHSLFFFFHLYYKYSYSCITYITVIVTISLENQVEEYQCKPDWDNIISNRLAETFKIIFWIIISNNFIYLNLEIFLIETNNVKSI